MSQDPRTLIPGGKPQGSSTARRCCRGTFASTGRRLLCRTLPCLCNPPLPKSSPIDVDYLQDLIFGGGMAFVGVMMLVQF